MLMDTLQCVCTGSVNTINMRRITECILHDNGRTTRPAARHSGHATIAHIALPICKGLQVLALQSIISIHTGHTGHTGHAGLAAITKLIVAFCLSHLLLKHMFSLLLLCLFSLVCALHHLLIFAIFVTSCIFSYSLCALVRVCIEFRVIISV